MNTLLLIDIQKDFHAGGSLAIPGADNDVQRIVQFIQTNAHRIHRIVATLDSHYKLHIAHPSFWIDNTEQRNHPKPFTIISSKDVQNGIWKPRPDMMISTEMIDVSIMDRSDINSNNNEGSHCSSSMDRIHDNVTQKLDITKYCIEYTRRLEEMGRFQLCIWPEHCLIGTVGHTLVDSISRAINEWTELTGRSVEYILKGQNLYTEMYSALAADVPISMDTCFNEQLHQSFIRSNKLIITGQALSHCVNYTVRDIVRDWPKTRLDHIYLLNDCSSSVPGFETATKQFISDMDHVGIQIVPSTDQFLS
jgi:nicotinamidase/pyrazinamidase